MQHAEENKQNEVKWRKIGTFTKRDVSGNRVIQKLHALLVQLDPKAADITDYAVDPTTDEYLHNRIMRIHGRSGPWLSLQYTPSINPKGEPFTIYKRVKRRKI